MTTYEKIKKLCEANGIAITAMEKDLGFGRGSIGKMKNGKQGSTSAHRLQKIADYFDVSVDYLMKGPNGENVLVETHSNNPSWSPKITEKEEKDIEKRASGFIESIGNDTGLMFNGQPIDDETRALFQNALEVAMKTASLAAKEKFTPNKYKK